MNVRCPPPSVQATIAGLFAKYKRETVMRLNRNMRTLAQVEKDAEMDNYYEDLYEFAKEEYLEELQLQKETRDNIRFIVKGVMFGFVSDKSNKDFFTGLSVEDKRFYVFYRDMVRALGI